jgi:hypothetical protein
VTGYWRGTAACATPTWDAAAWQRRSRKRASQAVGVGSYCARACRLRHTASAQAGADGTTTIRSSTARLPQHPGDGPVATPGQQPHQPRPRDHRVEGVEQGPGGDGAHEPVLRLLFGGEGAAQPLPYGLVEDAGQHEDQDRTVSCCTVPGTIVVLHPRAQCVGCIAAASG